MPPAYPVLVPDVLSVLNLPADMESNGVFKKHAPLVLELVRLVVVDNYYQSAFDPRVGEDDALYIAFRYAYCFFMLYSTCEFLNLKTLGEGIVKTVGLDQSATELLTGAEIDAFKANLEKRALTLLGAYLNPTGLARLEQLSPRPARKLRVGVI
jgi:hypothetical protein